MDSLHNVSAMNHPSVPKLQVTNKMLRMLAPMPATAMQLLNLLANADVSLQKLADVAVRDVGVSTALLRCANSATFGLRGTIGSITDAIRVIGTAQTRMVVLASGVSQIAMREMPIYQLPAGAFTAHSELVANATMTVARSAGMSNIGLAYATGLLHDLGKVVLSGLALSSEPRPANLAAEMAARGCSLLEAEEAMFGADHARVGKQLAELWALPPELADAVGRHHEAQEATPDNMLGYSVMLGNAVAGIVDPSYPRLSDARDMPIPEWLDLDKVCEAALHCGLKIAKPAPK